MSNHLRIQSRQSLTDPHVLVAWNTMPALMLEQVVKQLLKRCELLQDVDG